MSDLLELLPGFFTAHLQLSLLALAIAVAVSVPLGIWLTRRPDFEPAVLGTASVIQTIPSLALLAIMVPILAAVGSLTVMFGLPVRGIGFAPALIALARTGDLDPVTHVGRDDIANTGCGTTNDVFGSCRGNQDTV